jgi:hypothetical protein
MFAVRRPVAAVLSVASTVLVGGAAWGLVSAQADASPSAPAGTVAPAAAEVTGGEAAVPGIAARVAASATATTPEPATTTPAPRPVPPRALPPKATVPTTVTIQAVTPTVSEGQLYRAIFRGVLTATSTKKGLPQQRVVLMRRPLGASGWTRVVTAVSSAPDGKLLVAIEQQEAKADYKFVFDGQTSYRASTSGIVTIKRA